MISKSINFKNFNKLKISNKNKKNLLNLLNNNSQLIKSLSKNYRKNYNIKKLKVITKNCDIRIIGMGGSILGAKAIYNFLKDQIKKKFHFIDDLNDNQKIYKKKICNLIISKSGNTLETITNTNILQKKNDKNIFITENSQSYLLSLAENLKNEVIDHNNFIGGRYSVLSEVGMVPAELMGLKSDKFRQMNNIVKNKKFLKTLLLNVESILSLSKKKKINSVILNYDPTLNSLMEWYQQLVGESLGKKGKGILPIISNVPKDNHSLMQLYLDGFKKNFFTFFFSKNFKSSKINNKTILESHKYLKNKTINQIMYAQKKATEKVFIKNKVPFRSFEILKRDEKTLGELFIFFILETILLGKAMGVNPYDQPSVELIKTQTKKFLIK